MHFTVAKRIAIVLALMLLISTVSGAVFFSALTKVTNTIDHLLQFEQPIAAAANELEINAVESVLATTKYLNNQNPKYRKRLVDSAKDFDKVYANYMQLVSNQKGQQLGEQINQTYQQIKNLSLDIMDNIDANKKLFSEYTKYAKKTEDLLEDHLLPSISIETPQALKKIQLIQKISFDFGEVNYSLANYLHTLNQAHQQLMRENFDKFRIFLADFLSLPISPAQQKIALAIEQAFELTMQNADKRIAGSIALQNKVNDLITLRTKIDKQLDEGLQLLTSSQLNLAKTTTKQSLSSAYTTVIFIIPLLALLGISSAAYIVGSIRKSIRQLSDATAAFFQGDLSYRIALQGNDEFTDLSRHFNQMAERLEKNTVSKRLLEQSEVKLQKTNARLIEEVNGQYHAQKAIERMAHYDVLTDMPNRRLFQERLQQAILEAQLKNESIAVLLMDLNRFKEINDTLGHQYGDDLLQQLAKRLRDLSRESDTPARLGGDEFSILMLATDADGASQAAELILQEIKKPFSLREINVEISASIGISVFPAHGKNSSDLMRCADIAMYAAKGGSDGYSLYEAEHDQNTAERLSLVRDLNGAAARNELLLHYQPLVSMVSNQVSSAEALVRWKHPTRGLLMPNEFIALAEKSGAIIPITYWVLEEVIRQCSVWVAAGMNIPVAVNISALCLHDKNLPLKIGELLQRYQLPTNKLHLEITESSIMADPDSAMSLLDRLNDMGISLAIDDFGTGYSSLSYLSHLPVHNIKIDKSFVMGMIGNPNNETIVRSTIDLGHNLQLKVTAEGVEDEQHLAMLVSFGCDIMQGYYFSRPLAVDDFVLWMQKSNWVQIRAQTNDNAKVL